MKDTAKSWTSASLRAGTGDMEGGVFECRSHLQLIIGIGMHQNMPLNCPECLTVVLIQCI